MPAESRCRPWTAVASHNLQFLTAVGMPVCCAAMDPGMEMGMVNTPPSSGSPAWFAAVNWLGAVATAITAAFWTHGYVVDRRHAAIRLMSLGEPARAMTTAGVAIVFLVKPCEI